MALSNWLCQSSTKNMLVKIVYPGGLVELHDRPILAAEITLKHPRCCVAHPHVFSQPWAIVTPDTVLLLGQRFYVVPITTIRKLQRRHIRQSPLPQRQVHPRQSPNYQLMERDDDETNPTCWCFVSKNNPRSSNCCLSFSGEDEDGSKKRSSSSHRTMAEEMAKERFLLEDICFACLIPGTKPKVGDGSNESNKDESTGPNRGKERQPMKGSPKQHVKSSTPTSCFNHWKPSLESIREE